MGTGVLPALRAVMLVTLAFLLCGCGGKPALAEVEGMVTLDGSPLADVEVVFTPESGQSGVGGNASAVTDSQGRFRLRSDGGKMDGTAVGIYRVTVMDQTLTPTININPSVESGEAATLKSGKPRRFPATYGDLQKTPLTGVEVKPGKQTLNLNVKGRGK